MPDTATGQALMQDVRFAVDQRLQVLVAAGAEEGLTWPVTTDGT